MRRAGEALNEGGSALCRRLTITVAVLLLLSGRAFADWGYEEIEYTMAVLNATYPGLFTHLIFFSSKIVSIFKIQFLIIVSYGVYFFLWFVLQYIDLIFI